jgi:DNA-directed RNA polymerase specialized sigma subunit
MNNTIDKIRSYKEMLADIADVDIRVQELEEEILGVSGQSMGEKTGKTYKITSSVEQQAELLMKRKEQLYREQSAKKRIIERINNAMTILTEEEKDIIQIIHIERRKYYVVQDKLNLSYQRVKQLEKQAAKKMERYVS